MRIVETLLISATLGCSFLGPVQAGPCSTEIALAQASLDRRIEAAAAAGPSRPESRQARLHHQPTPESIAQAVQPTGSAKDNEHALAALAKAREADEHGDLGTCSTILEELRHSLEW
ncbi:MAG: hypothetical protein JO211_08740 [Acidobacteriaceae bacterium]|nr:hypothetical protein [Acidobacteriaceae bacterium]